ncbi:MAG: glycosyltransferase family 2 protein [Bacteroidota bacterium]|nr:glycosyltransferase family 2 protein [Bacteroidota bacterium]
MIYIIIPVFNRWNFTRACLKSLVRQAYQHFTIIVVDHGSTDNTELGIKAEFSEVIVMKGSNSLWWTGATNLGVKKALDLSVNDDDFILTLNNDLEVGDNYLDALIEAYNRYKPCFVGSVSVDILQPERVVYAGSYINTAKAKYSAPKERKLPYSTLVSATDHVDSDMLTGRGTLIPKKAFLDLGLFDERNFPHYMADEDFAMRGKKADYRIIVASAAVVKSHVSDTGINFRNGNKSIKNFVNSLRSIKSANNLKYRFNWAKKHGDFPYSYFLYDVFRIFGSYFKSILLK